MIVHSKFEQVLEKLKFSLRSRRFKLSFDIMFLFDLERISRNNWGKKSKTQELLIHPVYN